MHPDPEQLHGFVSGTLDDATDDRLADHVEQCQECEQTVRSLESASDTFIDSLRVPVAPDPLRDEPECREMIEAIRAFGHDRSLASSQAAAGSSDESARHLGQQGQYSFGRRDDHFTFDHEGRLVAEYQFMVSRYSFSPDGTRLAMFSQDALRIVSIADGADSLIPWEGKSIEGQIHWTPKGDGLLIAGKLYNTEGRELGELKDASGRISEFQWLESSSGAVGVSGSDVLIWPSVKHKCVRVPLPGLPNRDIVRPKDLEDARDLPELSEVIVVASQFM